MTIEAQKNIIAFFSGSVTVTIAQLTSGVWGELGLFGVKVLATVVLGIAGGIAGLAGKDIYNRFKNKFKKKQS